MNPFLVQILAMGLTVSQLFSKPVEQFKTNIDPQTGTQIAVQILKDGCGVLTTQINDSRFNVEVLLTALIADSDSEKAELAASKKPIDKNAPPKAQDKFIKKVDFAGLLNAYKLFCKNDSSVAAKINLVEVLTYYNTVFKNIKDVNTLKGFKFPEAISVIDSEGKPFSEMFGTGSRRVYVPLAKIPKHVRQAFISAEDQKFYQHKGVDLKGLLRAFSSIAGGSTGRPQGGSTITQQVAKNLLLNDDLTIDRKMREMLLAMRIEKVLTKDQILELYLNLVYLGRSSWGVEMAARSYFGPKASVTNLTIEQAALLAGLTKGPAFYSPDRQPERARDRRQYVLNRMREDCESEKKGPCPTAPQIDALAAKPIQTVRFESPISKGGFFFLDSIMKEAKNVGGLDLRTQPVQKIQSTIHPALQRVTEKAVQDGLMDYEQNARRKVWVGTQGSIAHDIEYYKMKWQDVLPRVQPRLYDVQWTLATIIDINRTQVGLADGQVIPLKAPATVLRQLKNYDLIFVDVANGSDRKPVATLKIPPRAQGAAVVLENQTGRVLAISGGFSYGASEFNRALMSMRQPGSTLKPFVYLAALNAGLQPNTLLPDVPPDSTLSRNWQPRNYDRQTRGLVTFRTAVENSLNLPTVQLAARLGGRDPFAGLSYVQAILKNMGLYRGDVQKPDFAEVLGSRETRLIDLAAAYAAVANYGMRPTPYFVESITNAGKPLFVNNGPHLAAVADVDRVAFYQLRRILEGTVARGTAKRLREFTGIVAGKTGTSSDESDAWFVCFTNDITIAVWVGYDDKKVFANLGSGSTGGSVALPIAEKILRASFELYRKPQKFSPPPEDVRPQVGEFLIDPVSGSFDQGQFTEVFRLNRVNNKPYDTIRSLLRQGEDGLKVTADPGTDETPPPLERPPNQRPDAAPRPEPRIQLEPEPPPAPAIREPRPTEPTVPTYRPGINEGPQQWRGTTPPVDAEYQRQIERGFAPQR